MSHLISRGTSRRRGSAIVEFGLAVSFLLLLLLGIVQFSLLYFTTGALNNAVREGARFGTVHQTTYVSDDDAKTKISDRIKARVAGLDKSKLNIVVTFPDGNRNATSRIKVDASYRVMSLLPGFPQKTLASTSTMRIEG